MRETKTAESTKRNRHFKKTDLFIHQGTIKLIARHHASGRDGLVFRCLRLQKCAFRSCSRFLSLSLVLPFCRAFFFRPTVASRIRPRESFKLFSERKCALPPFPRSPLQHPERSSPSRAAELSSPAGITSRAITRQTPASDATSRREGEKGERIDRER